MDSDKLIAKYRVLKAFTSLAEHILMPLLKIVLFNLISVMIIWVLSVLTFKITHDFGKAYFCGCFFLMFDYLFVKWYIPSSNYNINSFVHNSSVPDRLLNHYMKKWNTSEDQIKSLIKEKDDEIRIRKEEKEAEAKRKKYKEPERRLLRNEIDITKPLIYQLCMLNPEGIEEQKGFLKDIYDADTILHIVSSSSYCTEPQINIVYKKWRLKEISERRKLVNFLFKLAIVQDGIHLDEWNFLIKLMGEFRFSQALMSFYINRYSALRTEFEESEWEDNESSSTTGRNSNVDLNPYYAILGLDNSASVKEIKKAYHALALQYHPDLPKNANRIKECEEKMAKINEAYEKIRG